MRRPLLLHLLFLNVLIAVPGSKTHRNNWKARILHHGWDYDAMESLDECVDGEIIWLGRKVSV